jgi:small subunit ribosomal protein S17
VSPKKPKAQSAAPARSRKRAPAEAAARADSAPPATDKESEAAAPAKAADATVPAQSSQELKGARTLTGRVVSDKMRKTIAVEVERLIRHPRYGKFIRRTTRLLAHDEDGASHEGDLVTIIPCRPMSRHKSWRLLTVLAKAAGR